LVLVYQNELDTPTIGSAMPTKNCLAKINAETGEASKTRHKLGSPSVIVRFANCGLGYERGSKEAKQPASN